MKSYNKITLLFLISCLIGFNCKSTHKLTSNKAKYKSIYIDQFKLTYFRKVLLKSFNNSKAIQDVIQFDNSGFKEPILTLADYKLIDSLATNANLKLRADSINRIGHTIEEAQGKYPLQFIMYRLQSKWLDRLAKKRYKISGVKSIFK